MNRHQRFVEGQERKGRHTNTKEKERTAKGSVSREFPPTTNFTKHSEVVFAMKRGKLAKNDTLYTNIVHNKKDLGVKGDTHKQSLKERAL